jgi:hypothetical protein
MVGKPAGKWPLLRPWGCGLGSCGDQRRDLVNMEMIFLVS